MGTKEEEDRLNQVQTTGPTRRLLCPRPPPLAYMDTPPDASDLYQCITVGEWSDSTSTTTTSRSLPDESEKGLYDVRSLTDRP